MRTNDAQEDLVQYLTVQDVRDTVYELASWLFGTPEEPLPGFSAEPIPTFDAADLAKLDASLQAPRASAGGSPAYPTFADKAAILLYSLNKNHPWENGNKRLSMLSTFVFLALNEKWIDTTEDDFEITARIVANSESRCSKQVLEYLKCYMKHRIVNASNGEGFFIGERGVEPNKDRP